jgi:hypothetical protein
MDITRFDGHEPTSKRESFLLGKRLWWAYADINGYSWEPCRKGLKKLSEQTGLTQQYLRKYINIYLEA